MPGLRHCPNSGEGHGIWSARVDRVRGALTAFLIFSSGAHSMRRPRGSLPVNKAGRFVGRNPSDWQMSCSLLLQVTGCCTAVRRGYGKGNRILRSANVSLSSEVPQRDPGKSPLFLGMDQEIRLGLVLIWNRNAKTGDAMDGAGSSVRLKTQLTECCERPGKMRLVRRRTRVTQFGVQRTTLL